MIRDKSGWTPFATAMTHSDNKAAQAILELLLLLIRLFDVHQQLICLTNRSHVWPTGHMTDYQVTWLTNRSHDWPTGHMTNQQVTWLTNRSHDWLTGHMTNYQVTWMTNRSHDLLPIWLYLYPQPDLVVLSYYFLKTD